MARFRKKPVEIEAVEWDGGNIEQVAEIASGIQINYGNGQLVIHTLEGDMRANRGDWIIRGVQGELYPCKPEIFNATYESVKV